MSFLQSSPDRLSSSPNESSGSLRNTSSGNGINFHSGLNLSTISVGFRSTALTVSQGLSFAHRLPLQRRSEALEQAIWCSWWGTEELNLLRRSHFKMVFPQTWAMETGWLHTELFIRKRACEAEGSEANAYLYSVHVRLKIKTRVWKHLLISGLVRKHWRREFNSDVREAREVALIIKTGHSAQNKPLNYSSMPSTPIQP